MDQLDRQEMAKLGEAIAAVDRRVNMLGEAIAAVDRRVTTLDSRVTTLEKDVAVIKANYATKADVSDAKNTVIMWVVGSVLFAQLLPPLIKALGG